MNWLEKLKVDDEVVVYNTIVTTKYIGKIEHIDPYGDIWLKNDDRGFDVSGYCWADSSVTLLQLTSKILDEIVFTEIRHNLEDQCDQINWRELSIEQMQAILKIAKGEK